MQSGSGTHFSIVFHKWFKESGKKWFEIRKENKNTKRKKWKRKEKRKREHPSTPQSTNDKQQLQLPPAHSSFLRMHCHLPVFKQNTSEGKVDYLPNCLLFSCLNHHMAYTSILKINLQSRITYAFIPLHCTLCKEEEYICKVKNSDPLLEMAVAGKQGWAAAGSAELGTHGAPPSPALS